VFTEGVCGFPAMQVLLQRLQGMGAWETIAEVVPTAEGEGEACDMYRVIQAAVMNTVDGSLTLILGVPEVGTELQPMMGRTEEIVAQTGKVARQAIVDTGLHPESVIGGFSFSCGMNLLLGGNGAMQTLAERLCDTLNYAPTLGMIGGPEFGIIAEKRAATGNFMCSAVVFSNIPIDEPLSGRNKSRKNKNKSLLAREQSRATFAAGRVTEFT